MAVSGCDGNYPSEAWHLSRRRSIVGGAVTQLSAVVVAPSPHAAISFERQTMDIAACDRNQFTEVLWAYRLEPVSGGAVPQLALIVSAPGPSHSHVRSLHNRACPEGLHIYSATFGRLTLNKC